MLNEAPGLNVLNASARAKIAKGNGIIKEAIKNSSKIKWTRTVRATIRKRPMTGATGCGSSYAGL